MTFQTLAQNLIPKRTAPGRTWDKAEAAALLAVISGPVTADGSKPTATDGTAYADQKLARTAANKAKRLAEHVLPNGKIAKTVIFGLDKQGQPVLASDSVGKFGWAVFLADAKPPKASTTETPDSTPSTE